MIPREILKKVRRIEISTRGLVNEVLSGEYHSVFKGRGMNFAEVREYQYGDDIRSIDWNVTARTGAPFVKVFEEERELTVMLVVDVSASGDFGTRERMISASKIRTVFTQHHYIPTVHIESSRPARRSHPVACTDAPAPLLRAADESW